LRLDDGGLISVGVPAPRLRPRRACKTPSGAGYGDRVMTSPPGPQAALALTGGGFVIPVGRLEQYASRASRFGDSSLDGLDVIGPQTLYVYAAFFNQRGW